MSSVVLISGASTGLGRLTAETLARAGHAVYASMRDISTRNAPAASALRAFGEEHGLLLHTLEMDVCDTASVHAAVDAVLSEAGRIDVFVNNAGHMAIGIAEAFTEEQVQRQMDVNFMGAVRVSRAVLPHLRAQRKGLLIHVTSIVGRILFPACAFYCASKFALEAFAEVLNYELVGTGVESVIVEPGPYPSELLPNSPAPADADRLAGYGELSAIRDIFVGNFAQLFASAAAPNPQNVADAILTLVESAPGARALRTVCGLDFGATRQNELVAPIQAEVLRALGMPEMIRTVVTHHIGAPTA
jgi:NAD(P)-dependent dehydrogenase (short-subunit alcohol dehydrogenase family)